MEYFSGDEVELKFSGSADIVFDKLKAQLIDMYDNAYNSNKLGEIIYDNDLTDIKQAVPRDIFIKNFDAIFSWFDRAGTFESYLFVFKQILGGSSTIEFTKVSPGYLQIDIVADVTKLFNWITSGEAFTIVDATGTDEIMFTQALGISDYYQVEGIMNILNPAGIYLDVNFTIS